MRLDGRVVAITGGAGHIGRAFADAMAELGATVALLDLPGGLDSATSSLLERHPGKHIGVVVDLAELETCGDAVDEVVRRCGRLDVLVHCAALVGTSGLEGWAVRFEDQKLPAWKKALDVNLSSAFVLVQRALPALRASGHGSVVFVGSIYGVSGPDWRLYEGTSLGNPAAYAASKGGLLQMVKWLATTLAPDVRVNALSPGGVFRNTPEPFHTRYVDRTPLRRMAQEEDFKGAIAFLASDLSAYVTGQNLVVDGGWTAW
jgi:NAD(P)-dependent dehydrogenase (short-subunit alcohol dehydrogenase family)